MTTYACKNLKLILLLFTIAFGSERTFNEKLKNVMENRFVKTTCAVGAVALPALCWYYSGEMTMNTACQNPYLDTVAQYLVQTPSFSPQNSFVRGACASALALNSNLIKDELVRACTKIADKSQTVADWWRSRTCKKQNRILDRQNRKTEVSEPMIIDAEGKCKNPRLKALTRAMKEERNTDDHLFQVKKPFSDKLHWSIETFVSGFFSEKIYDLFAEDILKKDYAAVNKLLEDKLRKEFSGMKKFELTKAKIRTLKISSHEEKIQGDWAAFDVDIYHRNIKYLYTIIAFKGTDFGSIKDVFADADQNLVYDKYLDTVVPKGFHNSLNPIKGEVLADPLEREMFSYVAQDRSHNQRNIILTGHSLGGALAKLMATRVKSPIFLTVLKDSKYNFMKRAIKDARVYTFGAPQIFQKRFSLGDAHSSESNFTHFVMEHDPVPKLQLFKSYRKTYGNICKKLKSTFYGSEDECVATEEDVEFGDFGQVEILGCSSENTCSFSGGVAQDTIDRIRSDAERAGIVKTLSEISNHSITGYVEELKNLLQYEC